MSKPGSWNSNPGQQENPAYGTAREAEPSLHSQPTPTPYQQTQEPSLTTMISWGAQPMARLTCWEQPVVLPMQEAQLVILSNEEG